MYRVEGKSLVEKVLILKTVIRSSPIKETLFYVFLSRGGWKAPLLLLLFLFATLRIDPREFAL